MGQNHRPKFGDFKGVFGDLRVHVWPTKQDQRRTILGLKMAFHRRHFGGLMFKGIKPMHVTCNDLDRGNNRHHPHCHGKHDACRPVIAITQQMPRPNRANNKRCGQIGRKNHVNKAIAKAWIKDRINPRCHNRTAIFDDKPVRGLHPAVGRQNPER